ncbi:phosphatase PAP2 family protein [Aquibium carbonis]|uniref:Phosphatase PAP2 family protein n=1 Tax=Aquibium carbonis TaxID=2495581 RepID=A0A3R9YB42_9HYPH|nr:phosphatase PAP2 family protein [Aquibium carbonis]RST88295.1 phosphatase PAP2 family protein [Aquibium carbonis]
MIMPWIDLAVTGMFAAPDGSFPLSRHPLLISIRDVNRVVPQLLLPAMGVILFVHAFIQGINWLPRPHRALFVLGVYAIGSGLVVSVLKEIVERARPGDTTVFGGTAPYTIPWQLADACERNCSFSSGEAGSAAALMSVVVLAPAPLRPMLFLLLLPAAITFSLLRVAFGRHFLSDVFVSWLLIAIVAVLLWRWFKANEGKIDRAIVGSGLPIARAADRVFRVSAAIRAVLRARAVYQPALTVAVHRAMSWPRRR